MGASQLAVRIVGSIGRIDQGHLRTGRLTDEEWPRLTEAIERLRNVSLHIDETPGLTPAELRANARRLARQCGKLGLIVVDYLQLMSGSSSSDENRATELGEISRGLKALAKELQCPVIALSQLNRSVEQRTDKRPMMSDLRESAPSSRTPTSSCSSTATTTTTRNRASPAWPKSSSASSATGPRAPSSWPSSSRSRASRAWRRAAATIIEPPPSCADFVPLRFPFKGRTL
jgi:hypothetical protein